MALIRPLETIKSMSKKVCEHSDVYFRTNKRTGKTYTGKMCNPYDGGSSADQVAKRARFAKVSAAIRARLAVPASGTPTEEQVAIRKAYESQFKVGSLFGFAWKQWNDEYDANGDLIDTNMEEGE